MWGGIELREIETILILAEELHFGRTAERMGASTAYVSQTVRHVERRLGGALFERTSRRVAPTLLGRRLVRNLAPHVAALNRSLADAAATAAGLHGTLRMAHIVTVDGVPQLATLLGEYERRVPGVTVQRLRLDRLAYMEALGSGEVDVWMTWWPWPQPDGDPELGLRCGPALARQGAALLVGRAHPLADQPSISLEDLVEHPVLDVPDGGPSLFRETWIPARTPSGRPVTRASDPAWRGYFHELPAVLESGRLGWLTISSFLGTVSMPRTLVTVPIRDAPDFVLVPWWRKDRESAPIKVLAELIEELDLARPPASAGVPIVQSE